ncbi:MAG: hypothetical protein ABI759_29555 [Candidatus Solibacter sp.]
MKFLVDLIEGLHFAIGIRTPPREQVRTIAIVWLVSIVVIVGTLFVLLVYVF